MKYELNLELLSLDSLKERYCKSHFIVYNRIPKADEYPYNSTERNKKILIAQINLLNKIGAK